MRYKRDDVVLFESTIHSNAMVGMIVENRDLETIQLYFLKYKENNEQQHFIMVSETDILGKVIQ